MIQWNGRLAAVADVRSDANVSGDAMSGMVLTPMHYHHQMACLLSKSTKWICSYQMSSSLG